MSNIIALVGESGSGKTTSLFPNPFIEIKGLNPKETVIISVAGTGKDLIFPGVEEMYKEGILKDGANHIFQSDPHSVATYIRAIAGGIDPKNGNIVEPNPNYKHVKNIVIEDAGYFQGFMFMDKVLEKGYDKFSEIGEAGYVPVKAAMKIRRKDVNIIFTYHLEETNRGKVKIKTAGKVVDNILALDGLFSFIFYTYTERDHVSKKTSYYFTTQTDGYNTCKTPPGCFADYLIPNDMGKVLERIAEYKRGIIQQPKTSEEKK